MFLTVNTDGTYELIALYSFRNTGDRTIQVKMGNSQEIPFLKFPVGATGMGYEAMQNSAPLTSTADGFALPPNETPYGILAYASVAPDKKITLSQPITLPVSVVRVFVPEGMEAAGDQITVDSIQDVQGKKYQSYLANGVQAGESLTINISGTPKDATTTPAASPSTNNALLIGAGGLGIAMLLAGAWMYLRGRTQNDDEEEVDEPEFESAEDAMDAIIALDDLHRAKKISDDAYQKRRAELKEILKGMM
jgi:hypothetical protein